MGEELVVEEASPDAFEGTDIVFFAAGGGTSKQLAPEAARRGAVVIDKSSAWRMDPEVPLVIPEINPDDLLAHHGIISSPNCSTIVMLMALAPLHRANPIQRVIVDTYQSASGRGRQGHHGAVPADARPARRQVDQRRHLPVPAGVQRAPPR